MQTDAADQSCPQCSSALQSFAVNFDCKVLMCENPKCPYPFDQQTTDSFLMDNSIAHKVKKSCKKKHTRLQNSALDTALDTAPGAFSLEETIDSLLLNAKKQEHPDVNTSFNSTAATTLPATSYSLQDIENLLQDDTSAVPFHDLVSGSEDAPSTPHQAAVDGDGFTVASGSNVTTPIDNSSLFAGLDDLLDTSFAKGCDPFSTELDSLLGM
ncbi:hypothetical protein BJV82DRAFT_665612 [Fennellomyces sp. T-0311]|nr:hypothetical protein BJV82DRAFT_665612 [Fennellomyces sp. T-0311]